MIVLNSVLLCVAGRYRTATKVVRWWFESSNNWWQLKRFLWKMGQGGRQCRHVWSCNKEVNRWKEWIVDFIYCINMLHCTYFFQDLHIQFSLGYIFQLHPVYFSCCFLPRDAVHTADYAVTRCLPVHLSITCQYCVETVKHILELFLHHRIAAPFNFFNTICYGNILMGASNVGFMNISGFLTNILSWKWYKIGP